MKRHKIAAIIPARSGSKRLENKNQQLLNGKPLILHSINYAKQNSDILDAIYISTNDSQVEAIAMREDVKVIKRPENLCKDDSKTVSALKHAISNIKESYDLVVLLQPTNPLRPKNLLREAYKIYKTQNCDSLMTVTRNHQKFGKIANNRFTPFNYTMGQLSQDLDPLYFENGLLYITKASAILKNEILTKRNYPLIVNHPFANVDIDTKEDLKYAEFVMINYSK